MELKSVSESKSYYPGKWSARYTSHDKSVRHNGMVCLQAVDGDGLQIGRDAANIVKKMSQAADKGGLPAWGGWTMG